jgi:3-phenylpropionate/trans-cinnamate dioxygenase ferredoxin reductase subunit
VIRSETAISPCYYLRGGELLAADCANRPRDFVTPKRMITRGNLDRFGVLAAT